VIAVLVFTILVAGGLACLYYLRDDQRDETINVDQFRRERAAVISQLQADQQTRFTQRRTR
jgi:hypothetical protein